MVVAEAQTFNPRSFLHLSDTLSFHHIAWMDIDNDGLLDVAAFATDPAAKESVLLFRGDASGALQFVRSIDTGMADAAHFVTDVDGDNMTDIVISGQLGSQGQTDAFLNRGATGFERTTVFNSGAHAIAAADLDQDGSSELLLSGRDNDGAFLRILKHKSGDWVLAHDSIRFDAASMEVFDFDDDNDVDIFVSGADAGGMPATRAFLNQKEFYFIVHDFAPAITGKTAVSDLNGDGSLDVLLAGRGQTNDRLLRFLNTCPGFAIADTLTAVKDASIFAADLNSDGLCDVNVFGINASGDTVNTVFYARGSSPIVHADVVAQAFGDYEHDGDLDLVQLVTSADGYGLRVMQNASPATNSAPEAPLPIGAKIFNRKFFYWDKPADDHTDARSLTYDVGIESPGGMIMAPTFDLISGHRLAPVPGNNGTANYILLRPTVSPIVVTIQSVDNSLYGSARSVCRGLGGSASACTEMDTTTVPACAHERVVLAGGDGALWFSFRDGFLARSAEYAFDFLNSDTIFALVRGADCARIRIYLVGKGHKVTKETNTALYACEGTTLRLGVETGWENVEWSSAVKGFLSKADSIDFLASVPDTIRVMASDTSQCAIVRTYNLLTGKPDVTVPHEAYQIVRGQSVRLFVSGGASFQWAPSATLDDAQSSSPLASPRKTTEYTVVVTDSIGCQASARVLVLVEETAFIPNLFTPNRDGNNDHLKIYGLTDASRFSLTIYNREGSKVYQANSVAEVVNVGWDGTSGGVDQPAGVYYWNVKGETPVGRKLLLNGKNSGSVVLVR